ncbi:glycosyltransferase family 4 protein [Litoribacter ruber]|uniref:glycosyltransferase family 4 protein n=1 Tax=Litoribacter ruber TaxID=702568 RepID=UPI001BDA8904|nr:glycosyltransferase family 4 protein [Litoribacter ruber]MBT0812919.1 glycosyltransferase family 4 protein [Litoribacter ruber]
MKRKRVLFVGSFKDTSKKGGVGGQMFASKTIVKALSTEVEWTLIDTTAESNLKRRFIARLFNAMKRLLTFSYYLIFYKFDNILIFVADGWSFWEKGLMSLMAKIFTKSKVILAPRSGFIINDIKKIGFLSRFIRYTLTKVDNVVCQSQVWKNLFLGISNGDPKRFVIIENFLDFDEYSLISSFKKNQNEPVNILFLAWVTRSKGIFELLEASRLLAQGNLEFKVTIAGNGDDFEEAKQYIEKFDIKKYIKMEGWVLGDQKMNLLAESDIFVLPTHFEGYPNSLVEAMATGKACIATNVGSIPDIIQDNENGFLVEAKDSHQLYEKLNILISNPLIRKKFSENAMVQIEKNNSINAGLGKFKHLLNIK